MTPEPDPLANAYWKTDRAKFHLDSLFEAIETFRKDSHTTIIHDEPEMDRVRYSVELKQPHVYIFLILGDVLQCLRTALDQAIWSIIYHRTGMDATSSEFPIYDHPLNSDGRRKFNRKLEGLPDAAITYIESLQPYNRTGWLPPSHNPLWRLHELNRIDKHRRISVRPHLSVPTRMAFMAGVPTAEFADVVTNKTGDNSYEVVCSGHYKHLKPEITSIVLFGEESSGIMLTFNDVRKIYEFVTEEVLVTLAGFAK